jgi:hypothetical protein
MRTTDVHNLHKYPQNVMPVNLPTQFPLLAVQYTVELGYNVMKETEYFVSLQTNVVTTEGYNVTVNSEELIGTTEYLTL